MIDENGNKIRTAADKPYDFEFALKEIAFFMKHYRASANGERAFMITKMIHKYLENGGDLSDVADDFYEVERYAPHSRNNDFIWQLVYVRRLLCDTEKRKKNYEAAYNHRVESARHFERICVIRPTFHNKRVRIWEYMMATDVAVSSKDKKMLDGEHLEPLCRAKELLSELAEDKEANNNKNFSSTAKYVYQTEAVFMERTNTAKGEAWLLCLKNLIYYSAAEYRMTPDSSSNLSNLALYYRVAMYCDGYATPEVIEEINGIIAIAEGSAEASGRLMRETIKRLKDTRDKYIKAIKK